MKDQDQDLSSDPRAMFQTLGYESKKEKMQ